jgi:hypothetical protein
MFSVKKVSMNFDWIQLTKDMVMAGVYIHAKEIFCFIKDRKFIH